jgi:hypothetical protein
VTLLNEPFHFFYCFFHLFSLFPKFSHTIFLPDLPFSKILSYYFSLHIFFLFFSSQKLKNRIFKKNTILYKKNKNITNRIYEAFKN